MPRTTLLEAVRQGQSSAGSEIVGLAFEMRSDVVRWVPLLGSGTELLHSTCINVCIQVASKWPNQALSQDCFAVCHSGTVQPQSEQSSAA